MKNGKYDIHERIYQFIRRVLDFIKKIPKTYVNQVIIGQLIRAITSMGANDQEADGTFTRADFAHCYTVVRKEGKESLFWIRLLGDTNLSFKKESEEILAEGDEIVKIVTSIIFNTHKKK